MTSKKCLPPSSAHLVENSERMRQCNLTKEPRFGGKESVFHVHGVFHGFSRPCTNSAHTLPHLRGPQIGLSSINSWPTPPELLISETAYLPHHSLPFPSYSVHVVSTPRSHLDSPQFPPSPFLCSSVTHHQLSPNSSTNFQELVQASLPYSIHCPQQLKGSS